MRTLSLCALLLATACLGPPPEQLDNPPDKNNPIDGGTKTNPSPSQSNCLDASRLKVPLPYAAKDPVTLIWTEQTCESNGKKGYKGVGAHRVFDDDSGLLYVAYVSSSLYRLTLKVKQRSLSAYELTGLAYETGLDKAQLGDEAHQLTLVSDADSKPAFESYTLPTGVSFSVFIPSDLKQPGTFEFMAQDKALLEQVKTDLHTKRVVAVKMKRLVGDGKLYTYRFELSDGLDRVKPLSLEAPQ